ncbi:peptidase S10, partial [Mesorhizobium sp. M2D.F.Ca.ET.145.01.1.1]
MRSKLKLVSLVLFMLAGFARPLLAETPERPAPEGGVLSLLPSPEISDHSITIAGHSLRYQAKAGTLPLLSGKGEVTAEIFYVAYTLKPREGTATEAPRPITFAF